MIAIFSYLYSIHGISYTYTSAMNKKLSFTIQKTLWKARLWTLQLNGVTLETPIFMPVWTKATIKWVPLERMCAEMLWTQTPVRLILNNTFHLYLRPWDTLIKKFWGVHTFQNRNWLILTDSGWYQVFSLWLSKSWKSLVKIVDDGVWFQSPHDGSRHFFSPTNVIDIQRNLWSDIMMMLDICSPVHGINKKKVAQQMYTTHQRAKQAYQYHMESYNTYNWVLFPIVQWWLYTDLREESATILSQYAYDWIALWWLSVGETSEELERIVSFVTDKLPTDKPRYLMGVWTPKELRQAVYNGIDMFDCVVPTRLGRHWWAFVWDDVLKIKNAQYKEDFWPLDSTCNCHTCRNFTRAYLHHLIRESEMMGWTLLSLHNIAYLHKLMETIKEEIRNT